MSAIRESLLLGAAADVRLQTMETEASEPFPLSSAQQQLWFLQSHHPELTAYNLPRVFRLRGRVDVDALERAFQALVQRHHSLRTRFFEQDGSPLQAVLPEVAFRLGREDLTDLTRDDQEKQTALRVDDVCGHVFDLGQAPLLTARAIKIREDEYVLAVCLHHIVSDAWSNPFIARDLADAYRIALTCRGAVGLPSMSNQYRDHVLFEREQIASGALADGLARWHAYMEADVPSLELPIDRPRPVRQTFNGAAHSFVLDGAFAHRLQEFCRVERCTAFVVLLAAWQVLLAKYCDQFDFAIGIPSAGRRRHEVQELVGFFVATQVFRVRLAPRMTLREICRQVRADALAAFDRPELPLDMMLDVCKVRRDPVRSPLFQTLFDLRMSDDVEPFALEGVDVETLASPVTRAKFDLSLEASVSRRQMHGRIEYNTDVLDGQSVSRLADRYAAVLEAIVDHPERLLGDVSIVDATEATQLESVLPPVRFAAGTPVHRLIERQAERDPEAIALSLDAVDMTYRELNERANRLAHRLRALGVRPETRVGIAAERSMQLVVGILAVLKAGGAYVPLDPEYPAQRLSYLVQDSGIELLLTTRTARERLPSIEQIAVVDMDASDLDDESSRNPDVSVHADSLAYVIYTSGSTGMPKGTQVCHRNVSRLLEATQEQFGFDHRDVWTLFHSFAFDFSVWEIFGALCHGGRLVVVPHPVSRSPEAFLDLLRRQRVTVLNQTPSAFKQLLQVPDLYTADDLALRAVIFGGEALDPRSLRPWIERFGDASPQLINMYGITETTVHVTHRPIRRVDLESFASPIGDCLPDLGLRVLDSQMNPACTGVPGELYVAGAGLTRGYLNRPGLTAERFVADPFSAHGERLYRTGDLARRYGDARLDYLGRIDHQVKVRGFRIELGEIEAQLLAQPEVRQAVVIASEGSSGPRLVAYIVGNAEAQVDSSILRERLRHVLPDYMVPAAVVTMQSLPLTASGKLDRRSLPDPVHANSGGYEAPQGRMETALATVLSAVLGIERIGRNDNFFELGGDSILSLKVVAKARERSIALAPRHLFQHQTLSELARAVRFAPEEAIRVADRKAPLPLSHAQSRQWFLWRLDEQQSAYRIAAGLKLSGRLDTDALQSSLRLLVERHESLRTVFRTSSDGEVEQVIQPAMLAITHVDLSKGSDDARKRDLAKAAAQIAHAPFDLTAGPLFRAGLLRLSAEEHVLIIAMHHIVCDGWSMRVLVDEFVESYRAELSGRAPDLTALPIQYADYASWHRQWLERGEQERQLQYWRNQLGAEHPVLQLPTDHPRAVDAAHRAAYYSFDVPTALGESLRALALKTRTTMFAVLLAGFQALLHRYSGERDLRVGVPNANRNRPETQGVVGFFVNTQVLRCRLDGQVTLQSLLEQVRDAIAGAQEHQDLPFEQLVEALQPERSSSHAPMFQVMMNHQREDYRGLEHLPGLTLEPYPLGEQWAHFELKLDTSESDSGQLHARFVYAEALFGRTTMERFAEHYLRLLRQLAERPDQRLGDVDLLGKEEREQLQAWSNDERSHRFSSVCDLIDMQAREHAEATALTCGERTLSYAQLIARVHLLAQHLIDLDVGAEVRVGVHAERSIEFVVGVLAVLKAGGAYVPLDPQLPVERLACQVADSGAKILLSTRPVAWASNTAVIDLAVHDTCDDHRRTPTSLANTPHGSQSAYVIYTSGSTGQPKGVVVTHAALSNYVQGMLERLSLPADVAGMAMISTVAADLGHTVFFGALCSGRALHLIPAETAFDPDGTAAYFNERRVDVLKIVPSHLQALLSAAAPERVLPRHTLILGGEATSWSLLERIRALKPGLRVFNHYGPTETTVGVLMQPAEDAMRDAGTLPVGKPLPNAQCYVLDEYLDLAPQGTIGELYVGGGVARGYLERAALTTERFVASPFHPGQRLYRTGDLMKRLPDGSVEFLGRSDNQVKVHGFRIELQEVVVALKRLEQVSDAEAIVRIDAAGQAQLHGYIVPRGDAVIDVDALRTRLSAALPGYMIPIVFVVLDALPLTPNGKVDRKSLPLPGAVAAGRYEAPDGEVEAILAAIWAELLGIERVGRHDNFFALGGDSILTLQIVARALRQGLRIAPKALMERQTVASVAAVTARVLTASSPAVNDEADCTPFALTPIQRWFFAQSSQERQHWNQSLLLEMPGDTDIARLRYAVMRVIEHHGALRLSFVEHDGRWQQSYRTEVRESCFETTDLRAAADVSAAILQAAERAQRSLSLEQLFRAVWMDLGSHRTGRLLLVAHHLVIDGVSWRVLLSDLQSAYLQQPLPLPTASYRRWARLLQDHARDPALQGQLADWKALVGAAEPSLPCLDPIGANTFADAARVSTTFDEDRTEQLLMRSPQAYRTQIGDLLLTALSQTLCEWSERDSVLIEVEGHGREELSPDIDVARTVGWFTALYPVRLTPRAEPGPSIKAIKEQLRAIPFKGIGYGVLRYLTDADAILADMAYPQVSFNYLGQFDRTVDEHSTWKIAAESSGTTRSPASKRRCWFDVSANVHHRRLTLTWTYSRALHAPETIQRLVERFRVHLDALVAHCMSGAKGCTPSDFPLARVTQSQLDELPVAASRIDDLYPMTALQQGLLFHSLRDRADNAYVNQLRVDIDDLDVQRFRAAWQAVGERHDVLRTGFLHERDAPLQWVSKAVALPFIERDWSGMPDATRELDELAASQRTQPFDLWQPPLMRFALVRMATRRHHFIWTHHHLLSDGWSTSQLIGEVIRHYERQSLPPSRGRYRDYIQWLQQRDTEKSEAYWRNELRRLDEPTRLAGALPKSGHRNYCTREDTLERDFAERLQSFATRERVTFNTLLQATWALLLSRYTGQQCVTFGATTSGRPAELPGIEQMVGLFINTLPVIVTLRPEQSIGEWLRELQAHNLASREHEHTPLHEIQRWRGDGGEGLFDTLVVFENYPVDQSLRDSGAGTARFSGISHRDPTHYPLTLVINEGETLAIRYSSRGEYLGGTAVVGIALHVRQLLDALTQDAQRCIGEIELSAGLEKSLLREWSVNEQDYADSQLIHQLMEQQVEATPAAAALVFNEIELTYAELNRRANRLAHFLIARGIQPESRVGILLERSVDMVVSLLAVMKAGGAYVPLDPVHPAQRLAYMAQDSGIHLLLTQTGLQERMPAFDGLAVIALDRLDLGKQPEHSPAVTMSVDNLVYVIYTSGTTGTPKGVANRHRSLCNRLRWGQQRQRLQPDDVVLQKTPFGFDISFWEFFWPLATGAKLVLAGPGEHRDPARLVELVRRHGVTTIHFVPSMLQAFVAEADAANCDSLRRMICSGEALSAELRTAVLNRFVGIDLLNLYGPTEAAIEATCWSCERDNGPTVPIGRPIAQTRTTVLSATLNAVPPGVVGELYLGGVGLARGYLQRPGLTAERFIADPLSNDGGRLYRTGDLVRWNSEGQLDYLGRLDHQVKIHGYRIELGEIESTLLAQPEVREAVVVPRAEHLVAYLVGAAGVGIDCVNIRQRLSGLLPDYMVPSAWVVLEELPLSANGKLDRKALLEPEYAGAENYEPPQGPMEEALAAIWADALGTQRIGRNDSFFDLGGHSLLLMKVAGRIKTTLRVNLTVADLFEQQSLAGLAARLASLPAMSDDVLARLDTFMDTLESA